MTLIGARHAGTALTTWQMKLFVFSCCRCMLPQVTDGLYEETFNSYRLPTHSNLHLHGERSLVLLLVCLSVPSAGSRSETVPRRSVGIQRRA